MSCYTKIPQDNVLKYKDIYSQHANQKLYSITPSVSCTKTLFFKKCFSKTVLIHLASHTYSYRKGMFELLIHVCREYN